MAEAKFPSNSKTTQPAEGRPEVKAVVAEGRAKERKKSLGRRVIENFTGDDAESVGQHILMDVLIPAAKNAISDAVTQGIERMLFGEVRRGRSTPAGRPGNYTSYGSINKSPGRAFQTDGSREFSRAARSNHDFREIVFDERGEAERVLDELGHILDAFDVVTVGEMYSLVNITSNYTDEKWGWADLRGAKIERLREGYLLNLPRPIPLD